MTNEIVTKNSKSKGSEESAKKNRRSKGDGTIFKNSKGKWIARFSQKGYPKKEFSGNTKGEVKKKLDEYKFLVLSGDILNHNLSVENYAKKFLFYKYQQVERGKLKQTTYDRVERTFRCHIENDPIAKILMCNLDPSHIQNLLDSKIEGYSLSSINKIYLFFHSMVKHGKEVKDFPATYDPFATVELPDESVLTIKTKEIEIIPDEYLDDFKRVALSYREDGQLSYRYGPALVFMLNTGLREGELLAISEKGILQGENQRKRIHITETVSTVENRNKKATTRYIQIVTAPKYPRSNRIIPLNDEAVTCLNVMINSYKPHKVRDDLIVCTQNGTFPTARNIQETFDRILKNCGMPHYGTHSLRHTFATRLLKKTSNHQEIKAVAELLGDSFEVVVSTYLHTEDKGKESLVDMLND